MLHLLLRPYWGTGSLAQRYTRWLWVRRIRLRAAADVYVYGCMNVNVCIVQVWFLLSALYGLLYEVWHGSSYASCLQFACKHISNNMIVALFSSNRPQRWTICIKTRIHTSNYIMHQSIQRPVSTNKMKADTDLWTQRKQRVPLVRVRSTSLSISADIPFTQTCINTYMHAYTHTHTHTHRNTFHGLFLEQDHTLPDS